MPAQDYALSLKTPYVVNADLGEKVSALVVLDSGWSWLAQRSYG
jgi:hypothetical protein